MNLWYNGDNINNYIIGEAVTTFEVREPEITIPMDRDKFYENQIKTIKKTGKATMGIETMAVFLFNKESEIILQKWSHLKRHNPYLIDKAIGGHIQYGESSFYTTMVETVQELRVTSIILRIGEDFRKTLSLLLSAYLDNIAIIEELDKGTFQLERIIDGAMHVIPHKVHLYIGVYGGATKPVDKEASGVLYYSLDILAKEIASPARKFYQWPTYVFKKIWKGNSEIPETVKIN